jgi:gluconolactonase
MDLGEFSVAAEGLDHPEGLCVDAGGELYAGGEAGQVYRVSASGDVSVLPNLGRWHLTSVELDVKGLPLRYPSLGRGR